MVTWLPPRLSVYITGARSAVIIAVDHLANHFHSQAKNMAQAKVQRRVFFLLKCRSKLAYGLNWRLCGFFPLLKHSKYSARLRRWSNEYVWDSMLSCNWRYMSIHWTEKSSFPFYLPFFVEHLGLERKLVTASWQPNVIVSESLRLPWPHYNANPAFSHLFTSAIVF